MTYTKFHESWAITDDLWGAAWNHIETQWDAIKADADLHQHDSRYYTKATADATFFALTTSVALGMDADMLDGNHFTDLVAAVMPIGSIMIWSGTDGNVPTTWHICDGGTYGGYATPDLRDRFVLGAGDTYAVNETAGPGTWNDTFTPTGSATIGGHILAPAELPSHNHTYVEYFNNRTNSNYGGPSGPNTSRNTAISNQNEGGGSAHGHPGSTIVFTAVDPRPLYYSLYYIMKYM